MTSSSLCATINIAIVIATLVLNFVSAFPQLEQRYASRAITLPKRTLLTNSDGTFNRDKAIVCNAATAFKYHRNLLMLQESNGGALPAGMKLIDIPRAHIQARGAWQDEESLTDENDDSEWAGMITIGQPDQKFLVDFDTFNPSLLMLAGSSDLWIPSSSCNAEACSAKHKYNTTSSYTSRNETGIFSIEYGDGSTVSGSIFSDTVTVAGVKVRNQKFSAVTNLSSIFASDPVDGVLGLGFPSNSNLSGDPFFVSAVQQNAITTKAFSFYLATNNSELYLGGTNPKWYQEPIEYHPVNKSNGFWQVKNASINVGGAKVLSNFDTIIDSGTTIMYGPPDMVKEIYAKVEGAEVFDSSEGFYSFPCDNVPKISFSWGGEKFVISSENFNLGTTSQNASTCAGALAAKDLGLGDVLLLGDSWMKNAYHVFSLEKTAVGFAKLK
ncbi:acid protease [Lentinula aciculospora]|uniref:Acid protease n=1 Tax=Lentinula aciculospora TaxID=153920 RepID=A0A9W9DU26_9AGAR|nr:acid protease [Lentinula aciculospora]